MAKIKIFIKDIRTQIFTLFFLCLSLVILWFRKGLMFACCEQGIPLYNISKHILLSSYSWYEVGTGSQLFQLLPEVPYYKFLELLHIYGINNITLQALTFLGLMLTGCLSVLFLIRETIAKELKGTFKDLVSPISGVFYLLNPFSMTQVFGRGIYALIFVFALIPSFLLFFVLGLRKKNFIYAILAIFISFLLSSAYTFPSNAIAVWFLVILYFLFYLHSNKDKKDRLFAIVFFLYVFLGWVFTNIFWILPILVGSSQQVSGFLNARGNILSLRGVSRYFPLSAILRLTQNYYFYSSGTYGNIYSSVFFRMISFIIPFVSIFSISEFKKLKHYKFYFVAFIFGIFINLGSNFPTGWLFEFVFRNIPYLQIFRNPYEKLGLLLTLAYIPFFAIGLSELYKKVKKRFRREWFADSAVVVIVALVNFVFVWPMWSGLFSGGYIANPWIEVPNYYKEADDWLNNQKMNLKIIQFPLNPEHGVKFTWRNSYSGVEPSDSLFTSSSIGRNDGVNKEYYNVLRKRFDVFMPNISGPDPDISHSDFKSDTLYQELEKLGVGYIVLHHDIDTSKSGMKSAEETMQYLSKEMNINKIESFGELDIYQVGNPKERDILYSPDIDVTYSKINPTLYKIEINNAVKPFDLYFLELFDEGWEMYVDGDKIKDHDKVFSYANSWKLDKTGNYTVFIKYKPQEKVNLGKTISLYSTILLVAISLVYLWLKKAGKFRKKVDL